MNMKSVVLLSLVIGLIGCVQEKKSIYGGWLAPAPLGQVTLLIDTSDTYALVAKMMGDMSEEGTVTPHSPTSATLTKTAGDGPDMVYEITLTGDDALALTAVGQEDFTLAFTRIPTEQAMRAFE